jgi:hypothetical protein
MALLPTIYRGDANVCSYALHTGMRLEVKLAERARARGAAAELREAMDRGRAIVEQARSLTTWIGASVPELGRRPRTIEACAKPSGRGSAPRRRPCGPPPRRPAQRRTSCSCDRTPSTARPRRCWPRRRIALTSRACCRMPTPPSSPWALAPSSTTSSRSPSGRACRSGPRQPRQPVAPPKRWAATGSACRPASSRSCCWSRRVGPIARLRPSCSPENGGRPRVPHPRQARCIGRTEAAIAHRLRLVD